MIGLIGLVVCARPEMAPVAVLRLAPSQPLGVSFGDGESLEFPKPGLVAEIAGTAELGGLGGFGPPRG